MSARYGGNGGLRTHASESDEGGQRFGADDASSVVTPRRRVNWVAIQLQADFQSRIMQKKETSSFASQRNFLKVGIKQNVRKTSLVGLARVEVEVGELDGSLTRLNSPLDSSHLLA
jgi:hypothetical protein